MNTTLVSNSWKEVYTGERKSHQHQSFLTKIDSHWDSLSQLPRKPKIQEMENHCRMSFYFKSKKHCLNHDMKWNIHEQNNIYCLLESFLFFSMEEKVITEFIKDIFTTFNRCWIVLWWSMGLHSTTGMKRERQLFILPFNGTLFDSLCHINNRSIDKANSWLPFTIVFEPPNRILCGFLATQQIFCVQCLWLRNDRSSAQTNQWLPFTHIFHPPSTILCNVSVIEMIDQVKEHTNNHHLPMFSSNPTDDGFCPINKWKAEWTHHWLPSVHVLQPSNGTLCDSLCPGHPFLQSLTNQLSTAVLFLL